MMMISKRIIFVLFILFFTCGLTIVYNNLSLLNYDIVTLESNVVENGGDQSGSIIINDENQSSRPGGREDFWERIQQLHEEILFLRSQLDQLTGGWSPRDHQQYRPIKILSYSEKKRILITGGAGFVGSHLLDRLLMDGHEVIVVDNFYTGRRSNIEHWLGHPNFELIHHDIVNPLFVEVDEIYHLASPASPPHYMMNAVKTIKTNTLGTINMLGLAKRVGARILVASTSEVYGDPDVHPQTESYWGNVNPIGPRSCYDESKRVAESLTYAYAERENVTVRVARIFNTYGPRMHVKDGRVVSNFISQALQGQPLTVYGTGNQTRSFQYVSDLIEGLIRLMASNYSLPVNLGNPDEHTINEFAKIILNLIHPSSDNNGDDSMMIHLPAKQDDPKRRRPDITRARTILDWQPNIPLSDGLAKTINYFSQELKLSRGQN